jgi:hypothetical protein
MDPIGFGLENIDAIGRWRARDGNFAIDASGTLPDGRSFSGPDRLAEICSPTAVIFSECLAEKLLIYALGRGLEQADKPVIRKIARDTAQNEFKISSLILGIVNSVPCRERKGDRASQ